MDSLARYSVQHFLVILAWLLVGAVPSRAAEFKAAPKFLLKSPAFQAGGLIPRQFTCDGSDGSPPLAWQNAPSQTRALALIADDPDAPGGTWVHWLIYDLPAAANQLAPSVAKSDILMSGARQGVNDFGRIGYNGPCPPPGPGHRYHFKLYALDAPTGLQPRASKAQLLEAIRNHVLGQAELTGHYKR